MRLRVIVVSLTLMLGIMSRDMLTYSFCEELMTQFTPLPAGKETFRQFFQKQLGAWIFLVCGVLHFRGLSVVQELKAMTPRLL